MNGIKNFKISPVSMVTKENKQKIDITCESAYDAHVFLNIYDGKTPLYEKIPLAIRSGKSRSSVFLTPPKEEISVKWELVTKDSELFAETVCVWTKPREWTFYAMVSSHTDIGLHNSQYIQRYNSEKFLDMAMKSCDETEKLEEENQYRYVMEGTWFWNNYPSDRGKENAEKVINEYVKKGKIGICGGVAGNHTQVYGMEELCRSAYGRKKLETDWGVKTKTLSMIDNNGLSWAIVEPYVKSGFENIIFAPNQWNPLLPVSSRPNTYVEDWIWNTNAGGGGSRVDVRYDSRLPMVFYWEAKNKKDKLLVWCSTQYAYGGRVFGISSDDRNNYGYEAIMNMEDRFSDMLPKLEERYPFNVWLFANYGDDQEPSLGFQKIIASWNEKWKWPKIKMVGNIDEPFDIIRKNFDSEIPVLSGELTGGWYQHPLSAPELLAEKFSVDRALPTAEKLTTLACLLDKNQKYPKEEFRHAWEQLLYNDEHSYGTSGYSGRKVFETWAQHRDWIEKSKAAAQKYINSSMKSIVSHLSIAEDSIVVFNPTAYKRNELLMHNEFKTLVCDIPPFGYKTVKLSDIRCETTEVKTKNPPIVETKFYKAEFAENGSMKSIYDKELERELLNKKAQINANEFVYTNDNHKSFTKPPKANFSINENEHEIAVVSTTFDDASKAEIIQCVKLLKFEKRIEIDNEIRHISDMFNNNRYYRYAYYAFPFKVEGGRRYCNINGGTAEYAKDITGHGTDTYMSANEWCCVENDEFGVALFQADSQIVEFDRIHSDKADFGDAGEGSEIYVYLANDWLQMHVSDGEQLNFRFRYAITSYEGGFSAAEIPKKAELFVNPIVTCAVKPHIGEINSESGSFIKTNKELRFLNLKMAEDGNGIIARFFGDTKDFDFSLNIPQKYAIKECAVTEDECLLGSNTGFSTYRIYGDDIIISEYIEKQNYEPDTPLPIGVQYTGLISQPRASCGEKSGQLYLLWGKNTESDLSHYELYRSEKEDFNADESTFIAKVEPREYCVEGYEDLNLKEHTRYYYKVCAVNNKGKRGALSNTFSGLTRKSFNTKDGKVCY